ncbi:hypothetical protein FB567DRAFT_616186 [Paraphoma chrysanthemicola]|uniref:Uncharacterized protein n=1 Tax=Paraphoma chrysanthemicola TaxID=798071 RepID=A0A8K0VRV6_9PLEO|nr:hypothetical protein FB567DRAFT_616186 [Paraphoma chrysanthemicola]
MARRRKGKITFAKGHDVINQICGVTTNTSSPRLNVRLSGSFSDLPQKQESDKDATTVSTPAPIVPTRGTEISTHVCEDHNMDTNSDPDTNNGPDTNSDPGLEDEQPQEAQQLPPIHRLDTGIGHLPYDIRLEIYKAAFPEMLRTIKKDSYHGDEVVDSQQVNIQKGIRCWRIENIPPKGPKASEEDREKYRDKRLSCTCTGCVELRRRDGRFTKALLSHFARDPETRSDFLSDYVKSVQFHWSQADEQCSEGFATLIGFFEILRMGGLVSYFSHLTIVCEWHTTLLWEESCIYDRGFAVGNDFSEDVIFIGGIFSALHAYKIKAELTMTRVRPWLRPFLARMEELCKIHLPRESSSVKHWGYVSFLPIKHLTWKEEDKEAERGYREEPTGPYRYLEYMLEDKELEEIVESLLARQQAGIDEDDCRTAWCYNVDFSDQNAAS